ncbi:LysM peptidoglycan-binding domain-containing protein [Streptomyces lunaelactis]|uniref:LysM peptidoglycan-binding domain-containing protein n=1 Tax=Streptomyces lunaelactis TaxID=1535768 RepID=UPI001584C845|nr:LysM peptidoglycan-binding domain-containing protein [Streptomyces lunaelactis]NUK00108.1 LysM peptidoglycan-binding domain-containing protein [Streptomyces lunaelactis]NUK15444.1 LysM peptidoglycan-binding domain-containing protein [Streptomyces lunaelactis]
MAGSGSGASHHRCVEGDNLRALAWRMYGDAGLWPAIAQANDITDPDSINPGTKLLLLPEELENDEKQHARGLPAKVSAARTPAVASCTSACLRHSSPVTTSNQLTDTHKIRVSSTEPT